MALAQMPNQGYNSLVRWSDVDCTVRVFSRLTSRSVGVDIYVRYFFRFTVLHRSAAHGVMYLSDQRSLQTTRICAGIGQSHITKIKQPIYRARGWESSCVVKRSFFVFVWLSRRSSPAHNEY